MTSTLADDPHRAAGLPVDEGAPAPGRTGHGRVRLALAGALVLICAAKIVSLQSFERSPVWATYSIVVLVFIFGRFGFARLYRPRFPAGVDAYLPHVAVVVPAYNEEAVITATLQACLAVDYPDDRLQVVVVDDCSTDSTLQRIRDLEAADPRLTVLAGERNRGKRHVMARGIGAARDAEVLVFIDSDSVVDHDAVRRLVRYFADPSVGAVCGHTEVWNRATNMLTRMQAMQYFIAFRVYKAAEALFGSVTCCSGCFSGYRRRALEPVVADWVGQRFLGRPSTYGDDRSLTNFVLADWRVVYAPDARAHTVVPDRLRQFLRQQLRWKKSWLRESGRACRVVLRKPPLMALFYYLGIALPFVAPQVIFHAFVISPYFLRYPPVWYLGGIASVALFYGLYYRLHHVDRGWYRGIFFTVFYTFLLTWQLPYALLTVRDSRWGTR